MGKLISRLGVLFVAVCLVSTASCVSTKQAGKAERSGFLSGYAQLKPGEKGEALLLYVNPDANWSQYTKIMLDPIRAYASQGSSMGDISTEDLQIILNYMYDAVRGNLSEDFTIVKTAGPDTMRLRIALTEAKSSHVVLDTMSTVLPPGIAISSIKNVSTGSGTGVGKAGVEMELLDADSGQRLMAAVDERVGGKAFEGKFDKWADVKQSMDFWAQRLQTRLTEARSGD